MKFRLLTSLAVFLILISSAASARAQSESVQDESVQDDSTQYETAQAEPMQAEPAQAEPTQNDSAQATAAMQSDSGVGRVSLIHGDVSTQRGDSGDWGTATLNQPLVPGDRVSTGDGGRTEVQLDYANILRIDQRTQANITALSRTQIQIQLARGLANYSVLKDSEADVEIDAPNLSVHPRRGDGSYRITVFSDDQAEVMVRKGEADISTPQGSTHLRAGQSIIVRGTGNNTQSKIADAASRDDFDRWNSDRDNTIRNAQSWSRTNQYYVGSEDLDAHGRWTNVPEYGAVWTPTVAADWAPYRDGRWVWEPYWGWTWVSYEPWGWAPYHYGRWFMYGSSWVWWPGQSYGYRHYRPIWAPAYVSFFGFGHGGGGFSFGFGFGSVGWLPIGPCDGFYPWWGGYRNRFNVVNINNVHNAYNYRHGGVPPLRGGNRYSNLRLASINDRVRRGVSTVDARDFGRGRVSIRPVSRETFRDGRMVAGNLPVVPNRDSLLAGNRRATPPTVGRNGQPERFFSNNRNRPVQTPRSFDREVSDLHNAIQRDGRFTPIGGNPRGNAGGTNPRSLTQGRTAENPNLMKPSAGRPVNGSNQGSNAGGNQNWRRGGVEGGSNNPGVRTGTVNPGQRGQVGVDNSNWRRSPNSGASQGSAGNGSLNNPSGRGSAPVDRRTPSSSPGNGNQDWRRSDRPSNGAPRSIGGSTEAPASRDRSQDRGNDWRRMPSQDPSGSAQRNGNDSMNRYPSANSAPSQRDSGDWRQSAPRDSGRQMSRPQLDMRQPIVTPRYSGPSNSGDYRGNRGGYSAPRSAPSGGGYSAPRSAPSGGGYSAPRSAPSGGGGGHSSPRGSGGGGGGQHSSGNGGPHRGR